MEKAIQIIESKILCLESLAGDSSLMQTRIMILKDVLKDLKKEYKSGTI